MSPRSRLGEGTAVLFATDSSSDMGSLLSDSLNFSEYFVVHLLLFDYFLGRLFEKVDSVLHFLLCICQYFFHLRKGRITLRR